MEKNRQDTLSPYQGNARASADSISYTDAPWFLQDPYQT